MKTKVWKAFWDFEKEEKWLNGKAEEGLAMTGCSGFRYTFEPCEPGEYIYRIELLEKDAKNEESVNYLRFLEESGAEHVETYRNWIYLRKKAAGGPFELYNDLDSRAKHYQRVANLWLVMALFEFCLTASQIGGFTSSLERGTRFWILNVLAEAFILAACVFFFRFWLYYRKKIKQLQREREIHE